MRGIPHRPLFKHTGSLTHLLTTDSTLEAHWQALFETRLFVCFSQPLRWLGSVRGNRYASTQISLPTREAFWCGFSLVDHWTRAISYRHTLNNEFCHFCWPGLRILVDFFFQNIEHLSSCQGGSPKVWKKCAEKRAFSVRKSSWITFTRHRSVSQMAHFNPGEPSLTPRDTQGKICFKYWTF